MDKLTALTKALDEILEDDRVHRMDDGGYEVALPGGGIMYARRTDHINDSGDWTAWFTPEHMMPTAVRAVRPNEVVAWLLQG